MTRKTRRQLIEGSIAGAAGLLCASGVHAAQQRPRVAGRVVDSAGRGINGLDVLMYAGNDEFIDTTHGDGEFGFDSPELFFMLVFKERQASTTVLEVRQLAGRQPQQIVVDLSRRELTFARLYDSLQSLEALVGYALAQTEIRAKILERFSMQSLSTRITALQGEVGRADVPKPQRDFLDQKRAVVQSGLSALG